MLLIAPLALSACTEPSAKAQAAPPAPPPEVAVMTVTPEPIPYERELPGRVTPTRIAEVRARVGGLVVKRTFEQGSRVTEGSVLYTIDPAPYRVELASAEAALDRAEANLVLTRQQAERLKALLSRQAASQAQYDVAVATQKQAEADVDAAKASRDRARLNLDYTNVRAPISGKIGRALLTEGALIDATGGGVLATIQQLDPIYVDITQSVGELNRLRRDLASGELASLDEAAAAVQLILDDGTPYGHPGKLLFSDVTTDPGTGQVTLRVQFPNPHDELLPGMYVRARLQQGVDVDAITLPQQAIQRTVDGKAEVWVVKADDKVMRQPVELGPVVGSSWLVRQGLKPGERVVVEGFQRINAGMQVRPTAAPTAARTRQASAQAAGNVSSAGSALIR
ncbi:MexE family multidrug efflux RND transporter periplasmic adaptor subunit [Chelatococcus reniformis]|uniref:MexE family multidrug efflux RND transporter periplasmic adaptor subunit n=1 Tax=Chelatococcus reniformis TaxID=1494448 RepID=A0A916UH74_9HYPH|nr:MexE family multidrug efflux RND transporter periplasmic adaptor subunit [Chelatococcus reniformis]